MGPSLGFCLVLVLPENPKTGPQAGDPVALWPLHDPPGLAQLLGAVATEGVLGLAPHPLHHGLTGWGWAGGTVGSRDSVQPSPPQPPVALTSGGCGSPLCWALLLSSALKTETAFQAHPPGCSALVTPGLPPILLRHPPAPSPLPHLSRRPAPQPLPSERAAAAQTFQANP